MFIPGSHILPVFVLVQYLDLLLLLYYIENYKLIE